MPVISSQRFLDDEIVENKKLELTESRTNEITLGVWETGIDNTFVLYNGHHTLAAALELGLKINYSIENHPEGLTGEDLLEQAWMDSDWYNVETGCNVW